MPSKPKAGRCTVIVPSKGRYCTRKAVICAMCRQHYAKATRDFYLVVRTD